ncbi:GAF domain-containing protein [Rhodoferax saidenbachensis]|uniref:Histidine kinase n=1 Tax=Rhodoferax saidenbachensis TaxID=1484693 RepID=A0A1P8K5B8_9BURK|nr:GAF domain-containing protein [Rhodoferax saidenbachensis]APW41203.1 histidine kinase [Rhodoferax saidenbachensis]
MIPAPIPSNEDDRLAALRELLILNTPPEQRFDRIVAFAAQEFDVPQALISLVDADRLWFKAKVGLDIEESTRSDSFCAHAILVDEPTVVLDARMDPRFADNPNVITGANIRFYAGAPLTLPSGQNVGTLCVFDQQPHEVDDVALAVLSVLRDLVVEELLRKKALA